MGLRESKLCFLPYEEAAKRVTAEEMQRLRLSFKRASGVNGFMSQPMFAREVLGDCLPLKVCEQIYAAFGGTTKGITFVHLLCGLVLLTRGTREEKIKFIFNVYSSDGSSVTRENLENAILGSEGAVPATVSECFSQVDRLMLEDFSLWISRNQDITSLTTWLLIVGNGCSVQLTDSSEAPTFYQTLATVTHLQELDIIELEKKYWYLKSSSKTGKFDLQTFTKLVSPPIPSVVCPGLFKAFDENGDGHIDFREMACGISSCCRGTSTERHQFCFKVFDVDGDGLLSREEITLLGQTLLEIRQDNSSDKDSKGQHSEKDAHLMTEEILSNCGKDKDGSLDLKEYQDWASEHRFSLLFPKLLVQVCHIVLGLKPSSSEVELQVVRGWLERENQQGLKPGTIWYLISMSWWRTWKEHVNYQPTRRSSTGSMKRNGVLPSKANQAWSADTLRTKTIGRRESHPLYGNTAVSPANGTVNGHCMPGNDAVNMGPGQVDNTSLIDTETKKITILTGEGGKLKRTVPLGRGRDFEILPESVWRALVQWYGGGPALPRTVIIPTNGDSTPELELFPISLRIFRHAPPPTRGGITTWTGVGFGLSSFGFNTNSMTASHAPPKKYLAYLAAFSRMNTLQQVLEYTSGRLRIRAEDLRLWIMESDNSLTLLEEEAKTLEGLSITDNITLLLEVRNRDMSWPEEMSSLASSKSLREKLNHEPTEKGATGLSNLGNTCFMNSALQCLSNTQPLTQYFVNRCHYYELNRANPLGMKGHIARRYGDLVEDLWSGSSRSIAPLKLRWTIGRYAPRFNGFQQHDSQEFLSFLLDGLHEDLNRVHDKPYVELKDSDGRSDEIVSQEAWDNHFKRNQSIVVDLFQGQLKSQVRCLECGYVSSRFDPFTFLSLPLPMDNSIYVEIVVVHLEGVTPTKYGLLLDNDDKYKAIKKGLSKHCNIEPKHMLLVEIYGATVKNIPADTIKIRSAMGGFLYAYEIPSQSTIHNETTDKSKNTFVSSKMNTNASTQEETSPCVQEETTRKQEALAKPCSSLSKVEHNSVENGHKPNSNSTSTLPVDEDWFNEDTKKRKGLGILRKISPKPRKKIGPKTNGSYSFNVAIRKSSSSSSSDCSQSSVSNTDSGVVLNNSQSPTNSAVSGRRTGDNSRLGNPQRTTPGSSPSASQSQVGFTFNGFAVAVHRKMIRLDAYFLSHQKNCPSLFGIPVIVPCTAHTKQTELYEAVWNQVSRLLSVPAPGDKNAKDGSTGDYPFELRAVQKDGLTCSWCPWYRFCRGCLIACSDQEFGNATSYLAIEWDPTTLHLRYQSSLEKSFIEHESLEKSRKLQTEPIDLYECLRAFTKEEELGEDELWYCNKCRKHRLAVKKLEIWSLPPILVIHLKRFQYVNGHWVKSNKIVHYPKVGFDPSAFLVKRIASSHSSLRSGDTTVTTVTVKSSEDDDKVADGSNQSKAQVSSSDASETVSIGSTREYSSSFNSSSKVDVTQASKHSSRTSSSSSISSAKVHPGSGTIAHPLESSGKYSDGSSSRDGLDHQPNRTEAEERELDEIRNRASSMTFNTPTYKLYAMSCHSGVLGGGHYISYSFNPNEKWYCYNDSSCKECDESKLQQDSPYMLFYEQENLYTDKFLPKFKEPTPETASDDEEFENDVKRMCSIQ